MTAVHWLIPDIPRRVRDERRKEAYLTNEIIIEQERKRAQAMNPGLVHSGDFLKQERNTVANNVTAYRRRKSDDPEEIALSNIHII
jgi:hypothetical protein